MTEQIDRAADWLTQHCPWCVTAVGIVAIGAGTWFFERIGGDSTLHALLRFLRMFG